MVKASRATDKSHVQCVTHRQSRGRFSGHRHRQGVGAQIGRIKLFLLDTDIQQNSPEERLITEQLYGVTPTCGFARKCFSGIVRRPRFAAPRCPGH